MSSDFNRLTKDTVTPSGYAYATHPARHGNSAKKLGKLTRTLANISLLLGSLSFTPLQAAPPIDDPNSLTIVDLNAAMGLGMGPGNPLGTDLNSTDLDILANDLTKKSIPDVITLQEMAQVALAGIPGVVGLQMALKAKTGGSWTAYFGSAGLADKDGNPNINYYSSIGSDIGNPNETPTPSYAGNAILVREGSGIAASRPLTINPDKANDYGVRLQSSGLSDRTYDGMTPGALVGVQLQTSNGCVVNVFNTHIANNDTPGDTHKIKAEQIDFVREEITQVWSLAGIPTILTGDFNTEMYRSFWQRWREDNDAMRRFLSSGFRDASFLIQGTVTKFWGTWLFDYDHMLIKDFTRDNSIPFLPPPGTTATVYDSRISDHRALTMTTPLSVIRCVQIY